MTGDDETNRLFTLVRDLSTKVDAVRDEVAGVRVRVERVDGNTRVLRGQVAAVGSSINALRTREHKRSKKERAGLAGFGAAAGAIVSGIVWIVKHMTGAN